MAQSKRYDKIVKEAQKRFNQAAEWESSARDHWLDDTRFAEGDDDNLYQWHESVRSMRNKTKLTINLVRAHNKLVINDALQNKQGIQVKPVSHDASYDAAQIYDGIIKHIEYISDAQAAYDTATNHQVIGGWGYWRITTDYVNDIDPDEEIRITRVADPHSIYLDPNIQTYDGSDARWCVIIREVSKDEFEEEYPDSPLSDFRGDVSTSQSWVKKDTIRIAEYFRKTIKKKDRIHILDDDNNSRVRESEVKEAFAELPEENEPITQTLKRHSRKSRDTQEEIIEWFKIVGDKVVDENIWPGKYIPIVRVIGEETIIDGKLDRKGHTRHQKDAQRMYNFHASALVDTIANQTKIPFMVAPEAIQGYETEYANANIENRPFLPYNHKDEDGNPLPVPVKIPPPAMPNAYNEVLSLSTEQLRQVTGQYQATQGMPGNETSGKAIQARQRQGDTATYHFINRLAAAIRFSGKIIIDLIPHIYDTERVIKILGEDGTEQAIKIDPNSAQAHQQLQNPEDDDFNPTEIAAVLNPTIGIYTVEADIGPSYGTRRQEAYNAGIQMITQAPELMKVIGDLVIKNADFPTANEMSKRLRRMVPPQLLTDQTNPQLAQLQAQNAQAMQVIQQLQAQLAQKQQELELKVYDAQTKRLGVVADIAPQAIQPLVYGMAQEATGVDINDLILRHNIVSGQNPQGQPNGPTQGQPQ